ncbi:hypothetical protein SAPIO_CDS7125 [Scedosporium apiospermum]|uniref:Uncharacterized protein n=1 Tax=Pseudallescheria apiosperma TaxID=563466 RepID=A0A084G159_PSEDA|nr:uncharacterized protein SAPIO_CDS7125 [Scedosporium apiospermum]KEZ41071.1 hypothetical protein SAPIO_CDS7125 [Scedosporium apiospermum]
MTAEEEAKSAQATPKETTVEEPTDSDASRGRTKAREAPRASPTTTYRTGTGESSTLRGRTRWRSTSPLVSRNTSAQGTAEPKSVTLDGPILEEGKHKETEEDQESN